MKMIKKLIDYFLKKNADIHMVFVRYSREMDLSSLEIASYKSTLHKVSAEISVLEKKEDLEQEKKDKLAYLKKLKDLTEQELFSESKYRDFLIDRYEKRLNKLM